MYDNIFDERGNYPDATRKHFLNEFRREIAEGRMVETKIKDAWLSHAGNQANWELADVQEEDPVAQVKSNAVEVKTFTATYYCRTERAAKRLIAALNKIYPIVSYNNTTWLYIVEAQTTDWR